MEYKNHKLWRIAESLFPDKRPEELTDEERRKVINVYEDHY
jgi:hypothetical protein|tara:strand:- start:454 stop:576 length:123 start_codon:yes stop_codon:yes gene_type:complete